MKPLSAEEKNSFPLILPPAVVATIPKLSDVADVEDPIVHARLFNCGGPLRWRWYVIALDGERAYGLVDSDFVELGEFSLTDLKKLRVPVSFPIVEFDETFEPKPLSAVQADIAMRKDLLAKYAMRNPKWFRQYDGWSNCPPWDCVIPGDNEGHGVTGMMGHDLMYGSAVRVMIPAETPQQDAVRLLRKMLEWVQRPEQSPGDYFGIWPQEGETDAAFVRRVDAVRNSNHTEGKTNE